MGIRFESNYQRIAGIAPFPNIDTSTPPPRWFRVHEWMVDPGFTGKLLMVLLSVEPQFPVPVTVDYGWMRVSAALDTDSIRWTTKFEARFNGAALTAKQFTPRLTIVPVGSGITFTAGQGLQTSALAGTVAQSRWWSCYVIDAGVA
jgi:hypothetical protein